jgi:predicted permease
MSRKEARQAAVHEFSGVTQINEQVRADRGFGWVETLAQDVRFAVRMLWKSPGFTVVAVLTLALGIGGNTTIFSIVNGELLNPLPFPHADQLVWLGESKANFENGSLSYLNFLDWRKDNHSFSSMAVTLGSSFTMTGRGYAERLEGNFVSSGFFAVLGVRPLMGREFEPAEDQPGGVPLAMISEGLWRRKFGATPGILGQTITLDGKNYTIVGVLPGGLHLRTEGFRDFADVFVPVSQWDNSDLMRRGVGVGLQGIARLKPGVAIARARADLAQVASDLATAFPDADRGIGAWVIPLKEQIVGDTRGFLLVLLAAVGFVLLIACVNVASLLLARSAARSREFAVRVALGASRGRVVRQLLTESLLLGAGAGALGMVPAMLGLRAALRVLPAALPRRDEIGVDLRVLAFTTALSLLTGMLFGLAPALKTSKANPQTTLKEGGRGTTGTHQRVLSTFVVVEIAIALVLLAGAGLMIRSLAKLWNVDPGFNAKNVLSFGVSFPPSMASATPEMTRAKMRALNRAFAALPGISMVSQTLGAIPIRAEDDMLFWIDGQPKPKSNNEMSGAIDYTVDADYLRGMQIPLKRGRFLSPQDNEHAPLVVVIDEVLASRFFPGEDPIGKRIHLEYNDGKVAEIVGVVGHVKQWGLDSDDSQQLRAEFYLPWMQLPDRVFLDLRTFTGMVVRYDGSASVALDAMRRASRQMSADQVIFHERTMESIISDSLGPRRFAMILLGAFAAVALLLACVGIYGVMAYLVSHRTQEVGIRMALGAQRMDVVILVLRQGAKLALAGVTLGIGGAIALTRLMRDLLFNVSPTDPAVLAGVSALLVLVTLAACIIPAWRAASIDPMRALRSE